MRKILTVSFAALVVLVAVSVASGAASKAYSAKLTAGQETEKAQAAPANAGGTFKATLTGTTLKWTLTYAHLSGAAQQAHIHLGAKGKAGDVLVPLCSSPASCKSPVKGSSKLTAVMIKALNKGGTYVNVHTAKNLNGEIRGQILP